MTTNERIASDMHWSQDARAYAASEAARDGQDCLQRWDRDYTAQGLALRFSDLFGEITAYCNELGWVCWDGARWHAAGKYGDKSVAMRNFMILADVVKREALAEMDEAIKSGSKADKAAADEHVKFATKIRRGKFAEEVLAQAASLLHRPIEDFNADPYALNTPAGIVDLHTGEMRRHSPAIRVTKIAACSPAKTSEPGEWAQFVSWITGCDDALAEYLQYIAGMAAIGTVLYEGIVVAYGTGGNGKSTFFNALQAVLGDYATSISPDSLMVGGQGSEAVFAEVYGVRLAIAAESEEGKRLSVSTIKRLASTDFVRARRLFHDAFTFKPSHTLVMFTNHLPKIGSNDAGTWRRIIAIPFTQSRISGPSIKNYADVLVRNAGPEIMRWIVNGAVKFCANGYDLPEQPGAVRQATEDYRKSEDWVQNFLSECCTYSEGSVQSSTLYSAYRAWCKNRGEYARRMQDWSAALESAGQRKIATKGGKRWLNIRLNDAILREQYEYNS